jgi:broad specificity phosphatase PhoE
LTLYLLRHAQAGSRATWDGTDDTRRPLTSQGRRQAADLVGLLVEFPIDRVLTSPYLRCVETVAPLTARLDIPLEITESLAEGPEDDALALVRSLGSANVVMCSHGDIIPALLDTFRRVDRLDLGIDPRCQKSSVWMLEPGPVFDKAVYLPPPKNKPVTVAEPVD